MLHHAPVMDTQAVMQYNRFSLQGLWKEVFVGHNTTADIHIHVRLPYHRRRKPRNLRLATGDSTIDSYHNLCTLLYGRNAYYHPIRIRQD